MTNISSNNKGGGGGILVATATLGVTAITWYWWQKKKAQPLHIEYPPPNVPWAMQAMTFLLPASVRRSLIIKGASPKPPIDGVDALGNYNPYTELGHVLVPNKLWRVRYRSIYTFELDDFIKSFFGVDLADSALLKNVPPHLQTKVEQAMQDREAILAKNKGLPKQDQYRNLLDAGYEQSQDMLVLRLEKSGGLLLYNPCRMHPSVIQWLQHDLGGPVEWIVSGSSSHTNQLPQAAAAFPDAKILCAAAADTKCQAVGMRPADCRYTDPTSLQDAATLLRQASNDQLKLHYIQGDCLTQNLCLLAYNHLLEVDLASYGDGKKWLVVDAADWENPSGKHAKHVQLIQVFYYAAIYNKSVQASYLPNFRLIAMDPTCCLTKWLALDEPQPDSCRQMAQSIRDLFCSHSFLFMDSAHSVRSASVPVEEYKRAANEMWNWLDGRSLLEE